jgi:hypothetical protein
MSRPPYRALQIVLRVFSVLLAVGGLFMVFASKPLIMRVFLRPPESEVSTLLLFVLKEMGGFVLSLGFNGFSLRKKICDLQPCNLGCLDFPTVRDAIFQAEHGLIGEIDYRTIGLPQQVEMAATLAEGRSLLQPHTFDWACWTFTLNYLEK